MEKGEKKVLFNKNIQNNISEIISDILIKYNSKKIGLLTGNGGIVILLLYYYRLTNDEKCYNKAIELITDSITKINEEFSSHTFCNGICGFLWSLNHLSNNDYIDKNEIDELLNELDEYIYKSMMTDIKAGNYDFLHGAIGCGLYFLNRIQDSKKAKQYIEDLLIELENISQKEDDGCIKWLSILNIETEEKGYNFSISHRQASIIAFLGKVLEKNIQKEKVVYLLEGSLKFLLKHMKDHKRLGSYFTNWINESTNNNIKSRLAWCYGDLGISMVLFNIGKITLNEQLKQKAIEIMLFNSNRRNTELENLVDGGLCHGTAGVAHIYNRFYKHTGIEKFKETSDFWVTETLKMAKFNDGIAKYKSWQTEKHGGWVNDFGILEGVAGIGLALLSTISDIEYTWDECLLLS